MADSEDDRGTESTLAASPVVPVAHAATVASLGSEPDANAATLPGQTGSGDDYDQLLTIDSDHYVVGREIARGGMGRIRAARDRRLGRPVAIKELLVRSDELRARFEREARITAKLQHPAIVNLHEAGVLARAASRST